MSGDDERRLEDGDLGSLLAECFEVVEREERASVPSGENPPGAGGLRAEPRPAEADIASAPPARSDTRPATAARMEEDGPAVIRVHVATVIAFLLATFGVAWGAWISLSGRSERPLPMEEAMRRLDRDIELAPQPAGAKASARAVLTYALSSGGLVPPEPGSPLADLTARLSATGEDADLAAEFFLQSLEQNVAAASNEDDRPADSPENGLP